MKPNIRFEILEFRKLCILWLEIENYMKYLTISTVRFPSEEGTSPLNWAEVRPRATSFARLPNVDGNSCLLKGLNEKSRKMRFERLQIEGGRGPTKLQGLVVKNLIDSRWQIDSGNFPEKFVMSRFNNMRELEFWDDGKKSSENMITRHKNDFLLKQLKDFLWKLAV